MPEVCSSQDGLEGRLKTIPLPRAIRADMIPVKNRSGEVTHYVTPQAALRMIERGYLPLGTKTTIRGVQIPPGYDDSKVISLTSYLGQRYSHKHEAKDNPSGVWTLRRLNRSLAPIFLAVAESCGGARLQVIRGHRPKRRKAA